VRPKRIGGDGDIQAAKVFKPREKKHTDPAPIRAKAVFIEQFYVAVDRQLKSGFETYEAAEKAAQEIKKRYPGPQVTVFDAKEHRHTTIEQPVASTKRSG
jgi:hypothetical protein